MRRLIAFTLAASALFSPGGARAAETGTIKGRVVDGGTNEPRQDVTVTLRGTHEDGRDVVRERATTDADGRFSFTGLATSDATVYVIDAFFDGGLFAGRALQLPPDTATPPVIDTTIKVWRTTTDPTVVAITRDDVFLLLADGGVTTIESVSILNSSDDAYIGRGADLSGASARTPSLGFALPDEAEEVQIIDSNLDIPRLVATEFGFGTTVAIPPGENRFTFTYRLPQTAAQYDISRTVLYPTAEVSVHTRPPLTIESNRLTDGGEKSIEGTPYRVWLSEEPLDPGDSLTMLAIAEAGTPAALIGGIAAFAVLVGAIGVAGLRRGRGRRSPRRERRRADPEDVMTAIARLDLRYQSGDIDRDAWEQERARLKERLSERRPAG